MLSRTVLTFSNSQWDPNTLFISKVDEVYVKIEAESPIKQELSDFFTFTVPNAKFTPAYKNRMWDGKIRLFSPGTGQIYVGLLSYVKKFCEQNNIEYTIEKDVEDDRNIVLSDVRNFIRSLKPKTKGKSLKVRDYQIQAVQHAISRNRALLVSPTASGKSLVIYSLVRYYKMMGLKTLILVPTTSLVEQMYSDFKDYGWDTDNHCQKIYQGYDKNVSKDVVISTWQSIYKMKKEYFKDFGCVIGDEAHLFKSKSLTNIMTKLVDCKYRFGLTGTLDGTQTHRLVLEGLFGEVEQVTTTKALMDDDTIAKLAIDCIVLKHNDDISKQCKDFNYIDEINFLVQNKKRNQFIYNLCKTLKGNTLVLYQLVEKHGEVLNEMMKDLDKEVHFVHGGVGTDEREQIRALAEEKDKILILASYGVFSTGINIRNLHNVVFASPYKSRIKVLQSIGRGLRKSEQKDAVKLYDIADDLTYKNRKNFTLLHFQERINIYNEEEFNYKVNTLNL